MKFNIGEFNVEKKSGTNIFRETSDTSGQVVDFQAISSKSDQVIPAVKIVGKLVGQEDVSVVYTLNGDAYFFIGGGVILRVDAHSVGLGDKTKIYPLVLRDDYERATVYATRQLVVRLQETRLGPLLTSLDNAIDAVTQLTHNRLELVRLTDAQITEFKYQIDHITHELHQAQYSSS